MASTIFKRLLIHQLQIFAGSKEGKIYLFIYIFFLKFSAFTNLGNLLNLFSIFAIFFSFEVTRDFEIFILKNSKNGVRHFLYSKVIVKNGEKKTKFYVP